jgi:hypothetical protein
MNATIVLPNGRKATGPIREWTGPGECYIEEGEGPSRRRGVLYETWQRRQARQAKTVEASS